MNTLEFDFCQVENNELALPKFSGVFKIGWGNLFKAVKMAGEEALKQMVIAVVMQGINPDIGVLLLLFISHLEKRNS